MTLTDRIDAFKAAYPDTPAAWPWLTREDNRDVLYGVWVLGNDYRNAEQYYGTYPPRYLDRVLALFPDVAPTDTLHAFSGALPKGDYTRIDRNPLLNPDVVGDIFDAPRLFGERRFQLEIADPPYSVYDAAKYQALCDGTLDWRLAPKAKPDLATPALNQLRATSALASVLAPGGFLAWLDTSWPMHSKTELVTVGRIYLQRSTQHRIRACHLFERVA